MNLRDLRISGSRPLFPYPLVLIERKNSENISYEFITDSNVVYQLAFTPDAQYLTDEAIAPLAFSIVLHRIGDGSTESDIRIRDTLIYAIASAFKADPNLIISYVCSTDSNKERKRALKFGRWFNDFGGDYLQLSYSDSNRLYATTIFKKDHELRLRIEQEFEELYHDK